MKNLDLELRLKNKLNMVLFLSIVRNPGKIISISPCSSPKNSELSSYRQWVEKVSKKIDRWYEENKAKDETFNRDEDYR